MSDIRDTWVRLDATGGGATISVDGNKETYTFPLGNVVSRYGMLGLLAEVPNDGGEEVYKERLRAELLAQMSKYGVRTALLNVFEIADDDWL